MAHLPKIKEKRGADGVGPTILKTERAKHEAQFLIIPPGVEAQVISCPICKTSMLTTAVVKNTIYVFFYFLKLILIFVSDRRDEVPLLERISLQQDDHS